MIVAHFRRHQVPQKETWLDLSGWTEGDTMYDWEELEERRVVHDVTVIVHRTV